MKLFLDYLNKIKFHILLMIFPTIFTGIIFFLYQLSPEPVLYVALLWLLAGLTACMTGFSNYRKKVAAAYTYSHSTGYQSVPHGYTI